MAGVYLMLLMQFLENKVAVELTRSEFVEAQEVSHLLPVSPYLIYTCYLESHAIISVLVFPDPV